MQKLLLLLLLLQPALSFDDTAKNLTICESHSCKSIANQMIKLMNLSADPCDDFYEFACGNYENINDMFAKDPEIATGSTKQHKSPNLIFYDDVFWFLGRRMSNILLDMLTMKSTEISENKELNRLFAMVQQMQRSCMKWTKSDNKNYTVFADLLKPFMRKLRSDFSSRTPESLLALIVSTGYESLISVGFPFEFSNYLMQSTIPHEYHMVKVKMAKLRKDITFDFTPYLRMINASALELHDVSLHGFESELEQTRLDLVKAIHDELPEENDCFDKVNQTNNVFNLTTLDLISDCLQPNSSFSWSSFLSELVNSSVNASITGIYFKHTTISNLMKLGNFIKQQPMWSNPSTKNRLSPQMSFLIADWLLSFSSFMPRNLRKQWRHESYRTYSIHQVPSSYRTPLSFTDCVMLTKSLMMPIVEKMYQITHFPNYFQDVDKIFESIIDATERNIMKSWMTNYTKQAAVEKLSELKYEIGFHKLNDSDLIMLYADCLREFDEASTSGGRASFGEMLSIGLRAKARREFQFILRQSRLSLFLERSSFIANAFYSQAIHTVLFVLGILQSPYYDEEQLDYVKIGSIGETIGHEINHMFGLNLLASLNVNDSLETYSGERYNDTIRCIQDQLDKEEIFPGIPENNTNALGEDTADIMGISAAYEAWRHMARSGSSQQKLPGVLSKFSPDQIVYVRASQSHCFKGSPLFVVEVHNSKSSTHRNGRTRVRTMMRNNQEFGKLFQCKVGSPMNPRNKCIFW